MNYAVLVEGVEGFEKIEGDLPYEILVEFLASLFFPLDETLAKIKSTARSPPSAYSITMHKFWF